MTDTDTRDGIITERYYQTSDIPQRVFSLLVRLAANQIRSYQSDLYWDALWLRDYAEITSVWYWGIADFGAGTHVGTERGLVEKYSKIVYKVSVGDGVIRITPIYSKVTTKGNGES